MTENEHKKPKEIKIQIDREHYTVTAERMTGAELRQLVNPPIPSDRDLWQEGDGHADRKLADSDVVELKNGTRFFTAPGHINPGRER